MWLEVGVFSVINVLNTCGNTHMSGKSCTDISPLVSHKLDIGKLSRYSSYPYSHLSDATFPSFEQTLHSPVHSIPFRVTPTTQKHSYATSYS
jgi:hypothetical protein